MERTDFEQWKGREVARLLALVETERRYYQEMVATLPVGIAVLTGDRSVVLANRAFRETFSSRGEDVRRKQMEQLLPSDELIEKIRSVHMESSAEGSGRGSVTVEFKGKLLRIDIRPIRNWDDEMELETLLAVQDLSVVRTEPSRQTETSARVVAPPVAHEAVFPSADLPAIVWQANPETLQFLAVTGSAHGVLGFSPSHWMETEGFFEQRIHAEDRDATMALYRSILAQGGEASAEFRVATSTGDPQWCRETIVASAPGEEPRKMYGVLTFIGERLQMQRQMEVASRHAALAEISARLAHDLNNPLMLIGGYTEELAYVFPEGDSRNYEIQQISQATGRIAEVASHLLRFARHETTHPESVDLSAAVARLGPRFAGICGGGVAIRMESEAPVWALAEIQPLEDLMVTLADAAHDCAGCTELRIVCDSATISERIPGATLAAGTYARLTVQGNGTGLDAAKSASLFESILSKGAENARGESLALAYGMVREWGGDLAYSGDVARSTFVLYLRPGEPVIVAAPVEVPVPAIEPEPEPLRPLLLVVDDEPGIRALVAKILRRERFEVVEASTATEASTLAAAQARPVDLLLTDVMLPDHLGTELAEQLRAKLPAMKVLYMSGYTDDERAHAGDYPSGARFLQKPFTLSALVAKVRESLEKA